MSGVELGNNSISGLSDVAPEGLGPITPLPSPRPAQVLAARVAGFDTSAAICRQADGQVSGRACGSIVDQMLWDNRIEKADLVFTYRPSWILYCTRGGLTPVPRWC